MHGGFFSCDKEEEPIETVDPPIPLITGPTELTIPRVGMSTTGSFVSLGTIGAADLFWQLIKTISFMDNIDQIGSDPGLNLNVSIPGENEVRLLTDNSGGRTRLSQRVKVNPPKLPDKNYDLPVLLI